MEYSKSNVRFRVLFLWENKHVSFYILLKIRIPIYTMEDKYFRAQILHSLKIAQWNEVGVIDVLKWGCKRSYRLGAPDWAVHTRQRWYVLFSFTSYIYLKSKWKHIYTFTCRMQVLIYISMLYYFILYSLHSACE